MANVLGTDIPISTSFNFGSNLGWTITFIAIILVILILGAVGLWLIHNFRVFNKKIVVFENISGQGFQPVYKDRARLIKLGDGGEEILFLKKKKIYRTAYGRKMGKNTYWFAVGQDGYWYNIVLGDVDAKMGMLDVEPIDRDMRYAHVAIRKNISDRYKKVNIMDKYGTYIMSGLFLIIMLVGIWFLLNEMGDIAGSTAEAVKVAADVMDKAAAVTSNLQNTCGTSGLK